MHAPVQETPPESQSPPPSRRHRRKPVATSLNATLSGICLRSGDATAPRLSSSGHSCHSNPPPSVRRRCPNPAIIQPLPPQANYHPRAVAVRVTLPSERRRRLTPDAVWEPMPTPTDVREPLPPRTRRCLRVPRSGGMHCETKKTRPEQAHSDSLAVMVQVAI